MTEQSERVVLACPECDESVPVVPSIVDSRHLMTCPDCERVLEIDECRSATTALAALTGDPAESFEPDVSIPDFEDQEVLRSDE